MQKPPFRAIDITNGDINNPEILEGPIDDRDECIAVAESERRARYGDENHPNWQNVTVVDSADTKIWPID